MLKRRTASAWFFSQIWDNKIKEEQEELLRNYLNNDPAYSEEAKDKEKFRQFLANLNAEERQGLYDKALSNEQFKGQYENIRQEYANKYVGGFRSMQWENQISAGDLRSTELKMMPVKKFVR